MELLLPLQPQHSLECQPPFVTPILFAACLKNPVVFEDASENVREGAAAVPSCNFIAALSIEESAPETVMPPLKVDIPVNVEVVAEAKVPFTATLPELLIPVRVAKPVALIPHVLPVTEPSGFSCN